MTAIVGLLSAFLLLLAAIVMGGAPAAFVNGVGIVLVVLGTLAVTTISFSIGELRDLPDTMRRVVLRGGRDPSLAAVTMLRLAERARKDGIMSLKQVLPSLRDNPVLSNACQLVLDGAPPADAESILERESSASLNRYLQAAAVLRRAGEVAPAMGLIGTLIGLVRMLGSLSEPAQIGPAMAVALLTTLYGAILAHLVFLPLAEKAERMAAEESLLNRVYTLGATSIGRQENPRQLEMLINAILPPAKKVAYFK